MLSPVATLCPAVTRRVHRGQRGSRLRALGFLVAVGCVACAGEPKQAEAPLISVDEERAKAARPRGPRQLRRAEVDQALEAGLGHFLQHVFVEPSLVAGQFQGFRILELRPRAAWEGVDLRAGDIVIRINGKPIERPEQAHAVFMGLKEADRVVVSYVRDGQPAELVIPILPAEERPPAPPPSDARDL